MALPRTHAFTLVELSIVLVILGLLTGGILTGQSLIRAAELRSAVTEFQRYQAAVQTFRDKYRGLPGDITNARAFWGDGTVGASLCETPAGEPAHYRTCNGNGDGRIIYNSAASFSHYEGHYLWRHLALAGLIEGSYSGEGLPLHAVTYTPAFQIGASNVRFTAETTPAIPTSKLGGLRWVANYNPNIILDASSVGAEITFNYNYGHFLLLGSPAVPSGSLIPRFTSILKPEEVWNIDTKMDDGRPGIGKVLTFPVACTTAADSTQGSTAEYLLTSTTGQCGIVFSNAF